MHTSIRVVTGDLTLQDVDAIVNAANERLAHGGGVAAAIARAGGSAVQTESRAWVREHGPVGRGTAAVTSAGRMPARHVIHVVGPRYRKGQDNEGMLRQAVTAALEAARDQGDRSIAFPAISAGIFGYPRVEATQILADTAVAWVAANPGALDEIRFVGYDDATAKDFAHGLQNTG